VTPYHRRSFAPIREALAGIVQLGFNLEAVDVAPEPELDPVAALAR